MDIVHHFLFKEKLKEVHEIIMSYSSSKETLNYFDLFHFT